MRIAPKPHLLPVAAALLVFAIAPWGTFHLDDSLLREGLPFTARPLTVLSYRLNGQAAWALLLVNLVLHAVNSGLVYSVLARVISVPGALFAASIFAVHPMQAEAVNYISARPELLSALFSLLAVRDWLLDRPWRAIVWLAAALASKEEAWALGIVLTLLGWRGRERPLLVAFGLSVFALTASWAASAASPPPAPLDYFGAQGVVIWRYLRQTVFPWGFTLDPEVRWLEWGWAGWIAVVLVAWRFWSRMPIKLAVVGLLLLLPSSSIVPWPDLAADRRMYLPLASFAAALTYLPWSRLTRLMFVLALALLGIRQTMIWQSEETLWRWVTARSPNKLRPKLELARAVRPQECLGLLRTAEIRWPEDARVPAQMGQCALAAGDPAAAAEHFTRALALQPGDRGLQRDRDRALGVLTGR